MAPVGGLVFFAAAYSLYLYASTQHGKPPGVGGRVSPIIAREHLIMLLHWVPINFLVVKFSVLQLLLCFNSLYKTPTCGVGKETILRHPESSTP